jgi:hypothetical protein
MTERPTAEHSRALVLEALRTKGRMKQDVYSRTKAFYTELHQVLAAVAKDLQDQAKGIDERLSVILTDKTTTSCELKVAGDVIVFNMHTNVFKLDQSSPLWKSSYLEQDVMRGYFGVVNIYNFLNDSIQFDRDRDIGYLVARVFLNKEGHFFLQGKRQLGFLYNNLQDDVMDASMLQGIVHTVIAYVMEFDLLAPPYDQVQEVSVSELKGMYANQQMSTGKRLGFRSQADKEDIT